MKTETDTNEELALCLRAMDQLSEALRLVEMAVDVMHELDDRHGWECMVWPEAESAAGRLGYCLGAIYQGYRDAAKGGVK